MSLLDAYRKKLDIQIQEHKAHLELLKARATHAAAQSKMELAQADKHLDKAKAKFNELKGASGSALSDLRAGVKNALADLKVSTKKAARHFNAQPAPHRHRAKAVPAKPRQRAAPAKTSKK